MLQQLKTFCLTLGDRLLTMRKGCSPSSEHRCNMRELTHLLPLFKLCLLLVLPVSKVSCFILNLSLSSVSHIQPKTSSSQLSLEGSFKFSFSSFPKPPFWYRLYDTTGFACSPVYSSPFLSSTALNSFSTQLLE